MDRRAATGELSLAQLLRRDEKLAMAFACHLAQPADSRLRRKFNRQVVDSMTQDVLGTLLDTADFGTDPTTITGFGGATRVKNADIAMIGSGNHAQSVIEIRVHEMEPIEAQKLKALAKQLAASGEQSTSHGLTPPPSSDASSSRRALELQTDLFVEQMKRRRWELAERLRQERRKKNGEEGTR